MVIGFVQKCNVSLREVLHFCLFPSQHVFSYMPQLNLTNSKAFLEFMLRLFVLKVFFTSTKRPATSDDSCSGPVEYFTPIAKKPPDEPRIVKGRECSKKSVQQGRSHFDARSVLIVREHGKMARTPLAAFFNLPVLAFGF